MMAQQDRRTSAPELAAPNPAAQQQTMKDLKSARFSSRAMTLICGLIVIAALGFGAVATGLVPIPAFDSGTSTPASATIEQSDQQQVQEGPLSVGGRIQSVTPDIAKTHQLSRTEGVLVLDVFANSPLQRQGVRVNDLIVSIDGVPVKDASELLMKVRLAAPGQPLAFAIDRGGVMQNISVTVSRCLVKPAGESTTRNCTSWSH